MRIVLIGASGFFGGHLLRALTADAHQCRVLTRSIKRRACVGMSPGVSLVQADVYDPAVLTEQFSGADAVVSMAGILNEGGGNGFHKVHVGLVKGIVEACRAAGVTRLLHVSALNAGKGSSHYLQSKGDGLNVTIFQPSVIFGRCDAFFNKFAEMLALMPVLPLACPNSLLQPVFAGDVAAVMAASLDDPMTWGKTYELAGPKSYTLKQLVKFTAATIGKRRLVIGLPGPLSAMMAMAMNLVPGKPMSWDNYKSLKTDNVSDRNDFAYFHIDPKAIDLIVPDYLTGSMRQRRLQSLRRQPRR
jgi:NADH dehydrogenase